MTDMRVYRPGCRRWSSLSPSQTASVLYTSVAAAASARDVAKIRRAIITYWHWDSRSAGVRSLCPSIVANGSRINSVLRLQRLLQQQPQQPSQKLYHFTSSVLLLIEDSNRSVYPCMVTVINSLWMCENESWWRSVRLPVKLPSCNLQ